MTLKQLEYFFALCHIPHISKVALQLGVSQPAISLAIKALEEELDEPLFSRIGKKLVLNERGRFFEQQTVDHFRALKDASNTFKSDSIAGTLKIAASRTFNTYLMPQIIFEFQQRHPQVHISKRSTNSSNILAALHEGSCDIGFVESSFEDSALEKEKIGEDELIVVSADPALTEGSHYIDTLFDRQWILREVGSGTRDVFLDKLADIDLKPDIFLELPEFEEIKAILLRNPRTITCISKLAVRKELQAGSLFQVRLKNLTFARDLFVTYHRGRYQTLLLRQFLSFAKRGFQDY